MKTLDLLKTIREYWSLWGYTVDVYADATGIHSDMKGGLPKDWTGPHYADDSFTKARTREDY